MNFFKFAFNNVVRNIKAYFAYFLSSSISATLLFSFSMLVFHPDLDLSLYPQFLQQAFNVAIVIAYVFLIFFVFYSVSVFLKGRYKQFGTLYILGTSNKQIKKMIFIENIIICTTSAILGIVTGLVFSKIFLVASSKLLDLRPLRFYIPVKSIIIILIAFIFIGVLISAFTSVIIKENEVLKLLKGTSAPKQEPKTSLFLAILSIILLGLGYYTAVITKREEVLKVMIPIAVMVIVATYFIFSHFSVLIIKILKRNRSFYMNKTTVLWISNLFYKIKDNTRIFFLISITSAVAFTAIGGVYACWRDKQQQAESSFPQALYYSVRDKNKVEDEKLEFLETALRKENINFSKVNGEFKTIIDGKNKLNFISETTYRELSSLAAIKVVDFKDRETLLIAPYNKKLNESIVLNNENIIISKVLDKRILPALYVDVCVVKDSLYNNIKDNSILNRLCVMDVHDYGKTLSLSRNFEKKYESNNSDFVFISRAIMLDNSKILYGVLILLGLFIGVIFFVTTGSFIYNKLYMESEIDKKKYKQLNKIGLTFKEIKRISTIEIGVLFLLPYIVASIHSLVAMIMVKNLFEVKVSVAAFLVMGSFLMIQTVYFLIIKGMYLSDVKKDLAI